MWRSLVAHPLWERRVAGSNPVIPTDEPLGFSLEPQREHRGVFVLPRPGSQLRDQHGYPKHRFGVAESCLKVVSAEPVWAAISVLAWVPATTAVSVELVGPGQVNKRRRTRENAGNLGHLVPELVEVMGSP